MDSRFRWRWSAGHPSFRQHWVNVQPARSQPHTRIVRMETDFERTWMVLALNPMCLRQRYRRLLALVPTDAAMASVLSPALRRSARSLSCFIVHIRAITTPEA